MQLVAVAPPAVDRDGREGAGRHLYQPRVARIAVPDEQRMPALALDLHRRLEGELVPGLQRKEAAAPFQDLPAALRLFSLFPGDRRQQRVEHRDARLAERAFPGDEAVLHADDRPFLARVVVDVAVALGVGRKLGRG